MRFFKDNRFAMNFLYSNVLVSRVSLEALCISMVKGFDDC